MEREAILSGLKTRLEVVFGAADEVGSAVMTAILTTVVSFCRCLPSLRRKETFHPLPGPRP